MGKQIISDSTYKTQTIDSKPFLAPFSVAFSGGMGGEGGCAANTGDSHWQTTRYLDLA